MQDTEAGRLTLTLAPEGGTLVLPAPRWRLRLLLLSPLALFLVTAIPVFAEEALKGDPLLTLFMGTLCMGAWAACYAVLTEVIHRWLSLLRTSRGTRWLSALALVLLCLALSEPLHASEALLKIWAPGAVWAILITLGALLAGEERTLTFNHAVLVVPHGHKEAASIPWEDIAGVESTRLRGATALRLRGGRRVVLQSGLRLDEREWLTRFIEENVRRREAALASEGHDTAAAVRPPPTLEGLREH